MKVSPAGLFDEAQAAVWVARVSAELQVLGRVSLPGLGTLRPRAGRTVQFTMAPELKARLAEQAIGPRLNPAPPWVWGLPDLHGAVAAALAAGACPAVDLEGFGVFELRSPMTQAGRAILFRPSDRLVSMINA